MDLVTRLEAALEARASLFDVAHQGAYRLFNGFYEGSPELLIDVFAQTVVLHDYADEPESMRGQIQETTAYLQERLPWLQAGVLKIRQGLQPDSRNGAILFGAKPARRILENGVWYAINLFLNQDTSFYLDTRNVRLWAQQMLKGFSVLNTFAYTGSLGVAAMAGGASRVVQTDRNRESLKLAKQSYSLNSFPVQRADFRTGDFFSQISQMKRGGENFDCIFIDPPFFSSTSGGTINLVDEGKQVINKVRPLVNHDGWIVAINNALYLSGADYLQLLEELTVDGYLSIETLIPVPPDCTGYPQTIERLPPVDPAPFNHPTKIAVLRVKKKSGFIHDVEETG